MSFYSDVARLEAKLDGVTAILTASGQIGGGRNSDGLPLQFTSSVSGESDLFNPGVCAKYFIPDDTEAFFLLNEFRKNMAHQFPFIIVPSDTSPAEFRQMKPYLNMAIMMISSNNNYTLQTTMARKLRELVSHNMLLKGDQSSIFSSALCFV